MRILRIILLSALLATVFGPVLAGQITVTGQGRVEAIPDMATITLGVTSEARTAAKALAENSAATAAVLAQVADAGVAPRDIQTSGLSLSPRWNSRASSGTTQPQIVGYSASNQVTVRVRALDRLGTILDQVVQSGANNFHGLSFGLQNPVPSTDVARQRAVADAARKAALYAEAAGVALGPIVEISEAGGVVAAPFMAREMAMSDAVPIAQGEVSVAALVKMVFEIAE